MAFSPTQHGRAKQGRGPARTSSLPVLLPTPTSTKPLLQHVASAHELITAAVEASFQARHVTSASYGSLPGLIKVEPQFKRLHRGMPAKPEGKPPTIPDNSIDKELVGEMLKGVQLQADAICQLNAPDATLKTLAAQASAAVRTGLRPQGCWETVRIVVSHMSSDSESEALAIEDEVWPVLQERCAARKLLLLPLDLREGNTADLLPPSACLQQLEACAGCNEGKPFVVAVHGRQDGWEPMPEEVGMIGSWVYGLSLGGNEAFEAVCRLGSRSVLLLAAHERQRSSVPGTPSYGGGGGGGGGRLGSPERAKTPQTPLAGQRRGSALTPIRHVSSSEVIQGKQRAASGALLRKLLRKRLPEGQVLSYDPVDETDAAAPSPDGLRRQRFAPPPEPEPSRIDVSAVVEIMWQLICERYPEPPAPIAPPLSLPPPAAAAATPPRATSAVSFAPAVAQPHTRSAPAIFGDAEIEQIPSRPTTAPDEGALAGVRVLGLSLTALDHPGKPGKTASGAPRVVRCRIRLPGSDEGGGMYGGHGHGHGHGHGAGGGGAMTMMRPASRDGGAGWRGMGGGLGGGRPSSRDGAGMPQLSEPLRAALWSMQRHQLSYMRLNEQTPMLGRQVEQLRLLQHVLAQVGLAAPDRPGVPQEATLRPSSRQGHASSRVPLLLAAEAGTGKTRLLLQALQTLHHEQPSLHVAVHFSAAGGASFMSSRVALTHLVLQLLHHRHVAAAAAAARPRSSTAKARQASRPNTPGGPALPMPLDAYLGQDSLPAQYEQLCELCKALLLAAPGPTLVVLDGVERLEAPLEGGKAARPTSAGELALALGWLPSPLPPDICVLFAATADPDLPTEAAANAAALAAEALAKQANAVHAERHRVEANAAREKAAAIAVLARVSPVFIELRSRRPRCLALRLKNLTTEAGREVLRGSLRRLSGEGASATQLQPVLLRERASRPLWLRCVAEACARVKVEARLEHVVRSHDSALARGGDDEVAHALRAAAHLAAAQLREPAVLRCDEASLCGQAARTLQKLGTRATRRSPDPSEEVGRLGSPSDVSSRLHSTGPRASRAPQGRWHVCSLGQSMRRTSLAALRARWPLTTPGAARAALASSRFPPRRHQLIDGVAAAARRKCRRRRCRRRRRGGAAAAAGSAEHHAAQRQRQHRGAAAVPPRHRRRRQLPPAGQQIWPPRDRPGGEGAPVGPARERAALPRAAGVLVVLGRRGRLVAARDGGGGGGEPAADVAARGGARGDRRRAQAAAAALRLDAWPRPLRGARARAHRGRAPRRQADCHARAPIAPAASPVGSPLPVAQPVDGRPSVSALTRIECLARASPRPLPCSPRRDGAVWALACQHVFPFVQQLAGVWSFPHACFAEGLRPVVLQGGVGAEEHSELAEYFLCLLDPTFDSTFQGSDEPLALVGAPFHLLRCASATSNSPALAQLCGLLRCRALAVQFACAMHTPPLPVLLLESLCRGHDGTRSAEHVKLLQPETPNMLAACALPTTPTAAFPETGGEGAAAVAGVLHRIATRLELAQRAAEARAADRREQNQLHRGISDQERAVSHIQRSGRAYIFSHRQRTANDDRRRRYNERLAKRAVSKD